MAVENETARKLPPQNIEAEQTTLGAVLIESESIERIADFLTAEDFYRDSHRQIYSAMLDMHEKREVIDLVTLADRLKSAGLIEKTGGAGYLAQLVSVVPSAAGIESHARIVRDKAIFRRGIHAAVDIEARGYDQQGMTADEFLDHAEQAIFNVVNGRGHGESFVIAQKTVRESFGLLEKRYESKGRITGVPTGFVDLDEMTAGLQPTDLIIIAGRPSMGKTAFALNIAEHAAIDKKLAVGVFSMEMSRQQLILRMIGSRARVDANNIRTGNLAERDWTPLALASGSIAESKLFIDDTPGLTAFEVRARARRLKAKVGLDLIVIDYLQLMRGSGKENNREQEISGISRSLKALAKELSVPVIALSQLNRGIETRTARKPMLSDLRESGAIEQDADVIMFLHRPEVYDECKCPEDGECLCGRRGAAECIVGKQRNGPVGKRDLVFLARYTRFENAEKKNNW